MATKHTIGGFVFAHIRKLIRTFMWKQLKSTMVTLYSNNHIHHRKAPPLKCTHWMWRHIYWNEWNQTIDVNITDSIGTYRTDCSKWSTDFYFGWIYFNGDLLYPEYPHCVCVAAYVCVCLQLFQLYVSCPPMVSHTIINFTKNHMKKTKMYSLPWPCCPLTSLIFLLLANVFYSIYVSLFLFALIFFFFFCVFFSVCIYIFRWDFILLLEKRSGENKLVCKLSLLLFLFCWNTISAEKYEVEKNIILTSPADLFFFFFRKSKFCRKRHPESDQVRAHCIVTPQRICIAWIAFAWFCKLHT